MNVVLSVRPVYGCIQLAEYLPSNRNLVCNANPHLKYAQQEGDIGVRNCVEGSLEMLHQIYVVAVPKSCPSFIALRSS